MAELETRLAKEAVKFRNSSSGFNAKWAAENVFLTNQVKQLKNVIGIKEKEFGQLKSEKSEQESKYESLNTGIDEIKKKTEVSQDETTKLEASIKRQLIDAIDRTIHSVELHVTPSSHPPSDAPADETTDAIVVRHE